VTEGGSIRLASIHQIETSEILAGEEFKIYGDGFVPGDVEIVLDGLWLTPGRSARRLSLAFSGNAIMEKEISTVLPREAFARLGAPHALFEGSVKARFRASERVGPDYIEAVRSRITLDVLGNEPDGGRDLISLEKRTERFLESMGIEGRADPDGGFLLVRVDPAGPAGRSGLQEGDLVLLARGMKVLSEIDLLPPPLRSRMTLLVERKTQGGDALRRIEVRIPRQMEISGTDQLWVASGAVAATLVLLQGDMLALVLLPFRRLRDLVAALLRRIRPRGGIVSSEEDLAGSSVPGTRWIQNMLALPVVIATASACTALVFTSADRIHVVAIYLAIASLAWISGFRASRAPSHKLLARARRLVACLVIPAPVAFTFIWRGLYTLSPSLGAAAAGQGLEPWAWHGTHDPFALVIALLCLKAAVLGERRDIPLAQHLAHQAYSVATCAVVAYVMMGGLSPVLGDQISQQTVALRLLLYEVKVLVLYLLVQAYARDRAADPPSDASIMLIRPAALVGAMVGSVMLGPAMQSMLPALPQATAAAGAALALVLASSGRQAPGTSAIRIRPW